MLTHRFWELTGERAIKTFAQSLMAIFSAAGVGLLTQPAVRCLVVPAGLARAGCHAMCPGDTEWFFS
jgi:r1t holin